MMKRDWQHSVCATLAAPWPTPIKRNGFNFAWDATESLAQLKKSISHGRRKAEMSKLVLDPEN